MKIAVKYIPSEAKIAVRKESITQRTANKRKPQTYLAVEMYKFWNEIFKK